MSQMLSIWFWIMYCCISTPTTDSNTRTGIIWVTLNMPSAAEECREPSWNRQGISHCLESGHPVYSALSLCICWELTLCVIGVRVQANVRDVWNRFFKFRFGLVFEKKTWIRFRMRDSVQNEFGLVRFEKCSSDIIVIYYFCNSWVVNLQQILQRYCYVEWTVLARLCFGRVLKRSYLYIECR